MTLHTQNMRQYSLLTTLAIVKRVCQSVLQELTKLNIQCNTNNIIFIQNIIFYPTKINMKVFDVLGYGWLYV